MNFPFYIAKRYFFSKYTKNAVNIIALVSMIAVAVVTAAMVLIHSGANGFENLVRSMYDAFYPSVKIIPAEGKFFEMNEDLRSILAEQEGIISYSEVIEERAMFGHGEEKYVGVIKGVDSAYVTVSGLKEKLYKGFYVLKDKEINYGIVGAGVAARLSLDVEDPLARIKVYIPKKGFSSSSMFNQAFRHTTLVASGAYTIQQDIDVQYIFTNIETVRKLLGENTTKVSGIEIRTSEEDYKDVALALQEKLQGKYIVQNKLEQNASLYQVIKMEGMAVYVILSLVLFIAAFNIGGFLLMLILEKKKDFYIFRSMGADAKMVRNIIFAEGMIITLVGCGVGLVFAVLIVLGQQYFGWVKLPGNTFIVDAYPVALRATDLYRIIAMVLLIAVVTSWYPARLAAKRF